MQNVEHAAKHDAFKSPKWCATSGLGLAEAAKRFVGVMSLTWAGSQVTKVAVAAVYGCLVYCISVFLFRVDSLVAWISCNTDS